VIIESSLMSGVVSAQKTKGACVKFAASQLKGTETIVDRDRLKMISESYVQMVNGYVGFWKHVLCIWMVHT